MEFLVGLAFWLVASAITCAIVGASGALTGTLAASIFVIWFVLTFGGVLILDGDWDMFD